MTFIDFQVIGERPAARKEYLDFENNKTSGR